MKSPQLLHCLEAGAAHYKAGQLEQAEKRYRDAVRIAPRNAHALHLLGLVLQQQGRAAEAVDWLRQALRIEPNLDACELRLARALVALSRRDEAEQHARNVIARRPNHADAWDQLAFILKVGGRLVEALECHRTAVELNGGSARAWCSYGMALNLAGCPREALDCQERALAIDRRLADAQFGRGQALQQLDRPAEAAAAFAVAVALQPNLQQARSYRLLALHYLEDLPREALFAEHVAYGHAVGAAVIARFSNSPEPERRLRLAILSPDLRSHPCGTFLEPLLRHLDANAFDVLCYHDHFHEDEQSERLRRLARVWRNFVGVDDAKVAATIRDDAPDVLIDLAGHTSFNRLPLFAQRLAPVQISYLGYPDTTGVPTMDYRFTDAMADPLGEADRFATEKLVRFSTVAWAYAPPAEAPEIESRVTHAGVVFGCFNTLAKVTDGMLRVWGQVLAAVPQSRLLLKAPSSSDPHTRERLRERLAAAGIAADQVELTERAPDLRSHLERYQQVDVALDTFPYHGTTTTCEALWMGVPVVTLTGDRHSARVGASLLRAAGHGEWVAASATEYVEIARRLANDPVERATLRGRLRDDLRGSALLDHAGQSGRFAAGVRQCWRDWCAVQTNRT